MTRPLPLIEAGLAVLVAVVIIVLSPGVAIAGLIALIALIVCGLSLAGGRLRRRRRGMRARVAPPRRTVPRRGR